MIYFSLFILLLFSAWFSGMEIALFSLSSAKIRSLLLTKGKKAVILQRLLNNKHKLLVTILLGNNLVNIGAASLATVLAIDFFGSNGAGIATGVMTFLILIFGEMYPKAYFQLNAEKLAIFFAPFVYFLQLLFFPLIIVLEKLLKILTKNKENLPVSEKEFKAFSRLAVEKGIFNFEEHEMIMNVLEFNDIDVKSIMTPRYKISVLNDKTAIDQVAYFVAQEGFSRYPVYHNQKDNIIGYIHVIDIMRVLNSDNREDLLEKYIQPIIQVNENTKVNVLFNKMRNKTSHMAIITRKTGEILGLVTMEDVLESLVGDINDEKDGPDLDENNKK